MPVSIESGGITPGRQSFVTFDYAENLPVEPPVLIRRTGGLMFPETASNVTRLGSNIWVLRPINDLAIIHESAAAHQYTMRRSEWVFSDLVVENPRQRVYSELFGISPGPDVDTTGDYYCEKRIAAGATWNGAISDPEGGPTINNPNYPLDTLMIGPKTGTHAANTGYLLKLIMPGAPLTMGDYLFQFRFGGSLIGTPGQGGGHTGFGRYSLTVRGNGHFILHEWIDNAWVTYPEWDWPAVEPRQLAGDVLLIRILPHWPRFMEIRTFAADIRSSTGRPIGGGTFLSEALRSGSDVLQGIHTIDLRNRGPAAYAPANRLRPITGEGGVVVAVRRDLRMLWQVNRLAYPVSPGATGTIHDRAFVLPYGLGGGEIVRIHVQGYNHINEDGTALTSLEGEVRAADGSALTGGSTSYTFNGNPIVAFGWVPPGGLNKLKANFTLRNLESAGSSWHTPMMEAYEVIRNGRTQLVAPGEKTGGKLKGVSIAGASFDPEHETASLTIQDPKNELAQIRTRKAPCRIEVSYDPNNPGKRCVVFEGYTGRVTATKRGKEGKVYPSANWHDLEFELVGKWDRLVGKFFWQAFNFGDASNIPGGAVTQTNVAWKVTDIIRYLLSLEAFDPATQLDIPDLAIQLFLPRDQSAENLYQVVPGNPMGPYLKQIARDYLGMYLRWDANARAAGMWRLKRPSDGTDTPLWNFVSDTVPPAGKLRHLSASYGNRTSPILEMDGQPSYRTFTIPPECNVLTVFGQERSNPPQNLVRTYVNAASFDSPTHSVADVNSPDWLGRMVEVAYADPTLSTQEAVDFVARRIYNNAARGHVFHQFLAEYVLLNVADPSDPAHEAGIYTVRERRPLLPGDTVTVNGTRCVVSSANPAWSKDSVQCCWYEVEEWRYDLVYTR